MILIIRLDNDRYRNIMLIIILCGDGYCYMWAWMCGNVSRETIGKGREKGKRERGRRAKYGVWGCVCETHCFCVI